MKKFFKITLTTLILVSLVYHFFIYFDPANSCLIRIIPSFGPSNTNTKEALRLIKYASPADYALVCENVSQIDKNPSCGGFDGGCFKENQPNKIYIGNDQGNLALTSAIIVHETCHVLQNRDSKPFIEGECYAADARFLREVTIY